MGDFCNGTPVNEPDQHRTNCIPGKPSVLCCYDPVKTDEKGGHSYPYKNLVLAYDALDLLSVKNGDKEMWEIVPYGEWTLTLPFTPGNDQILGAAYDPTTQKLYVSQDDGDKPGCCGHLPVIHVFKLNLDQSSAVEAGDVNGDGAVNLADVILALQVASGLEPVTISIDGDGDSDGHIGLIEAVIALGKI